MDTTGLINFFKEKYRSYIAGLILLIAIIGSIYEIFFKPKETTMFSITSNQSTIDTPHKAVALGNDNVTVTGNGNHIVGGSGNTVGVNGDVNTVPHINDTIKRKILSVLVKIQETDNLKLPTIFLKNEPGCDEGYLKEVDSFLHKGYTVQEHFNDGSNYNLPLNSIDIESHKESNIIVVLISRTNPDFKTNPVHYYMSQHEVTIK